MKGLLFTGGKSSRMGRNKAFLEYQGRPQIVRCLELLENLCEAVFISCKKEEAELYAPYGTVVLDQPGPPTPVNGLFSAMSQYNSDWLCMPIDMPMVYTEDFKRLLKTKGTLGCCFIDSDQNKPDPLLGWYSKNLLPLLRTYITEGGGSLRQVILKNNSSFSVIKHLNPLRQINVNTPESNQKISNIMSERYVPVNCTFYDILEEAVVLKRPNTLQIIEKSKTTTLSNCVITDLYSSESVEFMTTKEGNTYRLDQIVSINGVLLDDFSNGCYLM